MSNQKHGAILRVDQAIGGSHIIGNRTQWVLGRNDVQSFGFE
jgi:hypothetical protein